MPRVFAAHQPNQDFSYEKAKAFGEVIVIFNGYVDMRDDLETAADICDFLDGMKFNEEDYLLLSGTKFLNAMVAVEMAKRVKALKVLVYVKAMDAYTVHRIEGCKKEVIQDA